MGRQLGTETDDTALIGVDWGTTHMRAYRISPEGKALECRQGNLGIAAIGDKDFKSALLGLIEGWKIGAAAKRPVILSGMIGSRQGWLEVPYRSCPARLQDLAETLAAVETGEGPAWIVGGLSTIGAQGIDDIMRGEETQIFGAVPPAGRQVVVAPGTHSKWATVRDGVIEKFRTYMTGEMYSLLRQHSILRWLMAGGGADKHDEPAFIDGVRRALADYDLLHTLFSVRTRGLFEPESQAGLASYLSGIVIGSEVSGASRCQPMDSVIVVAPRMLGGLYGTALSVAGFRDVRHVDANQAAVQGLWRLWQSGKMRAHS